MKLSSFLEQAKTDNRLPQITVYNRIDGPGSSLDLRLFQQSMWSLDKIPKFIDTKDPSLAWSSELPRTVGMTINVGTDIRAEPIDDGKVGVESIDFGFSYIYGKGKVPPVKENWLLRAMEAFGLSGVKFVIENQHPELKSAGLGGSAAVTTGVALLANALSGNKFSKIQIISMASMLEQDLGVSITGTQEQSCAIYGGVRDYVWFPWGFPGGNSGYGSSVMQEIVKEEDYDEIRKRLDVYFVISRFSKDVNAKWYEEMQNESGFALHKKKCALAYQFREGLRLKKWEEMAKAIEEYRKIRTRLCLEYMSEGAKEINEVANQHDAVIFPLGGGGGSIMVFSPNPDNILDIRNELSKYKLIKYEILPYGHKFVNVKGD